MPMPRRPRARAGCTRATTAHRQRLGHTDRADIMRAARRLETASRTPGLGLHGGYIRRSGVEVLFALLYRCSPDSHGLHPSLAQLAERSGYARSTVQEALGRLEAAGILIRIPRGRVHGGRWEQMTSAYVIRTPQDWRSDTDLRSALSESVYFYRETPVGEWPRNWSDEEEAAGRAAVRAALLCMPGCVIGNETKKPQ